MPQPGGGSLPRMARWSTLPAHGHDQRASRMSTTLLEQLQAELPIRLQPYELAGSEAGLVIADAGEAAAQEVAARLDATARGFLARRSAVLAFVDARPAPALAWLADDPDVAVLRKDCVNGFVGAIEAVHHGVHGTTRNRVVDWVNAHRLRTLVVAGMGTDSCVMEFVLSMLSARNHGLVPTLRDIVVLAPATAAPQPTAQHLGLHLMAARGALLAGELSGT